MKIYLKIFFFLLSAIGTFSTFAQQSNNEIKKTEPVRVAILAPIYIDSAFTKFDYRLGNTAPPAYIIQGLDFYNGAMFALDSISKTNKNIEVSVYDTKSSAKNINDIIKELELMNYSLVLASLTNPEEQKAISLYSFKHNIPVISCVYPNDADLKGNPYFVMLNPTLKTQMEALHNFIQNHFAPKKIIYLTRNGALENDIFGYFFGKNNNLNYKKIILKDDFTQDEIIPLVEKNKEAIIVCGSMNEAFASKVLNTLNNVSLLQQATVTVMGMPSWSSARSFALDKFPNINIIYSTAFNYTQVNKQNIGIISKTYKEKYNVQPTDMTYRGFECTYNYCNLLLKYKEDFINHLSDSNFKVLSNFKIVPVRINEQSFVPDYQENKQLYFISRQGSVEVELK